MTNFYFIMPSKVQIATQLFNFKSTFFNLYQCKTTLFDFLRWVWAVTRQWNELFLAFQKPTRKILEFSPGLSPNGGAFSGLLDDLVIHSMWSHLDVRFFCLIRRNLKACLPKVKCSPAFAWREIVALQSMLNRKFRITLPEYPRESSFPLMLELLFSFASFQVALFLEPGHSSIRYMHCGCSKTIGLGWGRREGTFDSMKTAHMPVLGSCRFSDFPKESFLLSHTPQSQGTLPRP